MYNKSAVKIGWKENLSVVKTSWILLGRTACVGITSRAILFTLLEQAFFSTKAQECILEEVIEILWFKAE